MSYEAEEIRTTIDRTPRRIWPTLSARKSPSNAAYLRHEYNEHFDARLKGKQVLPLGLRVYRTISQLGRDETGLYIQCYPSRGSNRGVTVRPGGIPDREWRKIFTPARLRKLEPPRVPEPVLVPAYNATASFPLVRNPTGVYSIGCQRMTRTHVIRLCQAILRDEGMLQ